MTARHVQEMDSEGPVLDRLWLLMHTDANE